MAKHFKMTTMEIASLTVLAVVVAIVSLAMLIGKPATPPYDEILRADSLERVIGNSPEISVKGEKPKRKTKAKSDSAKHKRTTSPVARDYIEEIAND